MWFLNCRDVCTPNVHFSLIDINNVTISTVSYVQLLAIINNLKTTAME